MMFFDLKVKAEEKDLLPAIAFGPDHRRNRQIRSGR
jgi:hypothetical protein